jgi:hypothetical protein
VESTQAAEAGEDGSKPRRSEVDASNRSFPRTDNLTRYDRVEWCCRMNVVPLNCLFLLV